MSTAPGRSSIAIELMSRADASGQWVHLLPAGAFAGRDGRGPYRLDAPSAVIAASREVTGRRLMPIDYDHQLDFATTNGKPAPAAGWIKALQAQTDGIWGLVEWTERAADHLARREYRYLSPVFVHTPDGKVLHVLRAALTNNPNLDQLTALASMETNMDNLAELRKLLSLPVDADMAAILQKVNELLTARQAAAPDPAQFVPIGDFQRAVTEVNRLNQGISLQAAGDHVLSQINAGKLPPFLKEWGVSLCSINKPAFDAFVDRTKSLFTRITGPSGATMLPPSNGGSSGLSEDEIAIASRMGLTEEEFLTNRARTDSQETYR